MKVIQNLHRWRKAKESLRKRAKTRTQLLHCVHETLGRFKHPQLFESRLEAHAFGEAHHLPCYLLGREVECCVNDWQSWAFYWAAFFFFLMGWVPVKSFIPHMAAMNHHWSQIRHGMPGAWYRLMHCLGQEIWESGIVIKLLLIWLPFF